MTLGWLEELLPPAVVSGRTKVLWLLFFALFPLTYAAGWLLERAEEGSARMADYQDRAGSIRIAEQFAATKGFSVIGWHRYVIAETRDDLLNYYHHHHDGERTAAAANAPAREVQVLFRSLDQSHEFRVYLSLTGRVTGFDHGASTTRKRTITSDVAMWSIETHNAPEEADAGVTMKNSANASDAEVEAIARRELSSNAELANLIAHSEPEFSSDSDDPARRTAQWNVSLPTHKELTLRTSVSVRDGEVVARHTEAALNGEFKAPVSRLKAFLTSTWSTFLFFCAFYAMIRYAKRTLQKEVSHARTLVMALLFWISYSVLVYSIATDQIAVRVDGSTWAKIDIYVAVFSLAAFAVMGLLLGIGYGSGEGELREAFPGKLTSLDALLAGKVLSKDVSASVLFGAAAAGWLLLIYRLLSLNLHTDVLTTQSRVLYETFSRIPWLSIVIGQQYHSLLIAVTGLLLPAAFLRRTRVKRKRGIFWLLVFAFLSVLQEVSVFPTIGSAAISAVIYVCALLAPFFTFDLLAAMVSLSVLTFLNELERLASVFPSWSLFTTALAVLGICILAGSAYLALRGQPVREEDVRPLYAKNLAERMSMQAEVLAAREAQLRLLPESGPALRGVEFAACCLPARQVGGDFYDFYQLDGNRVGIFIAQGGEQGLASALRIALAKGLLMHASQQAHTPTQIISELEASIRDLLEGGNGGGITYAYGVFDSKRNLLSYARIGEWPRFAVRRQGTGMEATVQLERIAGIPGRSQSAVPIYEGITHARTGDLLIFYTRGVTALRARRFGKREFQWVELLIRQMTKQEGTLQAGLLATLERHQLRASHDLTAVILRPLEAAIETQEGVA